jgi:hypothetical protein
MCSEEMYSYLGSAHRRRPALGRVVRQSAISRGRKVAPVRRVPPHMVPPVPHTMEPQQQRQGRADGAAVLCGLFTGSAA